MKNRMPHMSTRTRLLGTVFIGLCMGLCYSFIPQDGSAGLILALAYFVVAPVLLGLASRPLRSYRVVIYVSFLGCFFAAAHNLFRWKSTYDYFGYELWVVEFVMFWTSTALLLSTAVFVHRRYWPEFAQGHCQICGYDLRGSKERCPECGRPFRTDEQVQKADR